MENASTRKHFELSKIYYFQDTIILYELFENRANEMTKKLPYNPRKCTLASLLSGCIHFYLPKTTITFPTQADFVNLFEKTLIDCFSCCINTHLAFDSKILFLQDPNSVRIKNLKFVYKIRNSKTNGLEDKKTFLKILKMDENNQCGNATTGSIKNTYDERSRSTGIFD